MNDNIVTRLRNAVCWCNDFDGRCDTCVAADEIERLRTEITELQTRLRDTYKERDYWEWASRGQ